MRPASVRFRWSPGVCPFVNPPIVESRPGSARSHRCHRSTSPGMSGPLPRACTRASTTARGSSPGARRAAATHKESPSRATYRCTAAEWVGDPSDGPPSAAPACPTMASAATRPSSATRRRRRKVAGEAVSRASFRTVTTRGSPKWASPRRAGAPRLSAPRRVGVSATGPSAGTVSGATARRAHAGRVACRATMRVRRLTARSVLRIAAMGLLHRKGVWITVRSAPGSAGIKPRGCDTHIRPGFSGAIVHSFGRASDDGE